ncbi:MAG: thioredoxin domain-containing protein [Rhodomicrobium sp.]
MTQATGVRAASPLARLAAAAIATLSLAGCAGGLPDLHSISSLSLGDGGAAEKPKGDQPVNLADLIQPGTLEDIAIGKANAPVTIVQYVSLNCSTCGKFHNDALPKLKKAYIDKGKARLVFREFPEDNASATAALAVRCVPAQDYLKAMEKVLSHQKEWAGAEANKDGLYKLLKFTGLKRDKFDACLADKAINDGLTSAKERAKGFGVTVSPTFFVNAKKVAGAVSYEEMQGFVDAAYAATQAPAAAAQPQQAKPKA